MVAREQQRKQGAAGDREQADPAQSTSGGLADGTMEMAGVRKLAQLVKVNMLTFALMVVVGIVRMELIQCGPPSYKLV